MLGNDVIDLNLAGRQSDWKRKNYLSKIFSFQEQALVFQAENPDLVVWLVWSMKEAAYKIVNRITGLRFYNPVAFQCSFKIDRFSAIGKVSYKGEDFFCTTEISGNFLHTVALQNNISFDEVKVIYTENRPDYLEVFNYKNSSLRLNKNNVMLPEIHDLNTRAIYIASLSHHGRQLCIAYLKGKSDIV